MSLIVYGHHGYVRSRRELVELFDPERPGRPTVGELLSATVRRVSGLVPEIMQRDVMALPPWFTAVPPDERVLAAELLTRLVAHGGGHPPGWPRIATARSTCGTAW